MVLSDGVVFCCVVLALPVVPCLLSVVPCFVVLYVACRANDGVVVMVWYGQGEEEARGSLARCSDCVMEDGFCYGVIYGVVWWCCCLRFLSHALPKKK